MPNAHLTAMVRRYEAARAAARTITDQAAADGEHGRDLTPAELEQVRSHTATAGELAPQIEALAAEETRAQQVAAAAAAVGQGEQAAGTGADGAGAGEQVRGEQLSGGGAAATGTTRTQDRDPGHYRAEQDGGRHSFFADLVRAREGDDEAATRLNEHNRALSTGVAGAGLVAPNWLTGEYEALARQGRVASAMVRQIPITNPAPMTLQRQTAGTDAVVAEQATENTHPAETDAFATTVDVVTPKPTSGIQVISRQMIDMASPAADLLIYGDMQAVYNRKVEDKVVAAMVAAAGTPTVTLANEAAFTAAGAGDAVIDAAMAVWNARKLPADIVLMRVARWGRFKKFKDTAGRPLYPNTQYGPMNVQGVGTVQSAGEIEGLAVAVTDGLGIGGATYPENIVVARASDTILFEGALQRFRYEEVAGPESVKLGIWAYTAVIVRQAANSVRRIQVTAAV